MKLPSLTTAEGLATLDQYLLDRSFISGYSPSRADLTVLRHLLGGQKISLEPYTNIARWAQTVKSYSSEEQGGFTVGEPVEIELVVGSVEAAAGSEVQSGLVLFFLVLYSMRHPLLFCCLFRFSRNAPLLLGIESFFSVPVIIVFM